MDIDSIVERLDNITGMLEDLRADLLNGDYDGDIISIEEGDNEFEVGSQCKFVCQNKNGELEVLEGTVFEINLCDEFGFYNRVAVGERKFKVPINKQYTRKSTKVL